MGSAIVFALAFICVLFIMFAAVREADAGA